MGGPHDVVSLGAVLAWARLWGVGEGEVGGINYTVMSHQRYRNLREGRRR